MNPLDQFIVVLNRPRDVRNIGAVVRAMKNMGFRRLRLVEPAPFADNDIRGIAHRSDDILAALEVHAQLPDALADARYVVGTSGRSHAEQPLRGDVRGLAGELIARAATGGPIALLFGPEDNGLDNAALEYCHILLSLPASPDYPSLNLAQAVLLLLYELRQAGAAPPDAPAAREVAPAGEIGASMAALGAAVDAVGFVKSGGRTAILRRLRALLQRAEPDSRELALLTAFAREIVYALERARIRPPK